MFHSLGGSLQYLRLASRWVSQQKLQFDLRGHNLTLPTNLELNDPKSCRLGFRSQQVISSMRRKAAQLQKKVSFGD